jgi:hypothetical protein
MPVIIEYSNFVTRNEKGILQNVYLLNQFYHENLKRQKRRTGHRYPGTAIPVHL